MEIDKFKESLKKIKEAMGDVKYSPDGKILLHAPNDENFEISEEATIIGSCAFEDCTALREINIPLNIKLIKNYAFYGCKNLKKITIPANTRVSENTFIGCNPSIIEYLGTKEKWQSMDVFVPSSVQILFAKDAGMRSLRYYNAED